MTTTAAQPQREVKRPPSMLERHQLIQNLIRKLAQAEIERDGKPGWYSKQLTRWNANQKTVA